MFENPEGGEHFVFSDKVDWCGLQVGYSGDASMMFYSEQESGEDDLL